MSCVTMWMIRKEKMIINDEALEKISGGQEVEIVFGAKDLSLGTSDTIQPYTEPNNEMKIIPFVENTQQKIQEYKEPSNNFYREGYEEPNGPDYYLYKDPTTGKIIVKKP